MASKELNLKKFHDSHALLLKGFNPNIKIYGYHQCFPVNEIDDTLSHQDQPEVSELKIK